MKAQFPTSLLLLAVGVFAATTAMLHGLMDSSRFWASEVEAAQAGIALGWFGASPGDHASFSWLVIGAIWLAEQVGLANAYGVWLAQTVLYFSLWRTLPRLTQRWFSPQNAWIVSLFILLHPITLATLIQRPSLVVVILLWLLALISLSDCRAWRKQTVLCMALGASGEIGWLTAIQVFLTYLWLMNRSGVRSTEERFQSAMPALGFLSITTVLANFDAIAWNWGVIESFLGNASWSALLDGTWSMGALSLLGWLGSGGTILSGMLPIFGALALIGLCARWIEHDAEQAVITTSLAGLVLVWSVLAGFSTGSHWQMQAMLPFVILAAGFGWGLQHVSNKNRYQGAISGGLAGVLLLLGYVSSAFQLPPALDKARYEQSIVDTLLGDSSLLGENVALRFAPSIWLALGENHDTAAWSMYDKILLRPTKPLVLFSRWNETIDAVLAQVPGADRESAIFLGNVFVVSPATEAQEEFPTRIVGEPWDFNSTYDSVRSIGLAFGVEPNQSSAAPSRSNGQRLLGFLESEPFAIEGDALQVSIDLPPSSTSTLLSLSVFGEWPFGATHTLQFAEHVYDIPASMPLVNDTFVYSHPQDLDYSATTIEGWRVVRLFQGTGTAGWETVEWTLHPWKRRMARWHLLDRDGQNIVRLDSITQVTWPEGRYWTFEDGTYSEWVVDGNAFGEVPAFGSIGPQTTISGHEGNYFVNSFFRGSDAYIGSLRLEPFVVEHNTLRFRVGGSADQDRVFVGLRVDGEFVLQATGQQDETLRPVSWDLTPFLGREAQIEIIDASDQAWGHILVDDIRLFHRSPVTYGSG